MIDEFGKPIVKNVSLTSGFGKLQVKSKNPSMVNSYKKDSLIASVDGVSNINMADEEKISVTDLPQIPSA